MKNLVFISAFILSINIAYGQNAIVNVNSGACNGYDLALNGVSLTPLNDCEDDLGLQMQPGQDYTLTTINNTALLNGISTLDLVIFQRHLSGLELLDSPLEIYAADFDQDGALSTYDYMEMFSLILGRTSTSPHQNYQILGPNDAITNVDWWDFDVDHSQTVITSDNVDVNGKVGVTIIKLGDLNNSAE